MEISSTPLAPPPQQQDAQPSLMPLCSTDAAPPRWSLLCVAHVVQYFPQDVLPLALMCSSPTLRLMSEHTPSGVCHSGYSVQSWEDCRASAEELFVRTHASVEEGGEDEDARRRRVYDGSQNTTMPRWVRSFMAQRHLHAHYYPVRGYARSDARAVLVSENGTIVEDPFASADAWRGRSCSGTYKTCGMNDDVPLLRCTSVSSLESCLLSVWWLRRSYTGGVALHLDSMKPAQCPAFAEIRAALRVKELTCSHCVLSEEWMQSISTCEEVELLSICRCATEHAISFHSINPILTRPHSGHRGLSRWYVAGLRSLGTLAKLRCLRIIETPLHSDVLSSIVHESPVEVIVLHQTRGIDSLECLASLPRLHSLSLRLMNLTNDGAQHLRRCTALRHLNLSECRRITDLSFLPHLTSLVSLNVARSSYGEEHMRAIGQCTKLRALGIQSLKHVSGIAHLSALHSLELLNVAGNVLQNAGCASIANMPELMHLNMSCCRCLTSLGQWVGALTRLSSLDLSRSYVDSAGLVLLHTCSSLRYLNLSNCSRVTSIAFVEGLTALQWLDLSSSSIADAEATRLQLATPLRYLSLKDCPLIGSAHFVQHLHHLQHLNLEATSIQDDSIPSISAATELRYLNLSHCRLLTDIEAVAHLHKLVEMDLSYTYLTNGGVAPLAHCPSMEVVRLIRCPNLSSLHPFSGMKSVREIVADSLPCRVAAMTAPNAELWSSHNSLGARSAASAWRSSRTTSRSGLTLSANSSITSTSDLQSSVMDCFDEVEEEANLPLQLPALQTLSLRKSAIHDAMLEAVLCGSTRMVHVDLSECRNLTHLQGLPSLPFLMELNLSHAGITNAGLKRIADSCPGLLHLTLSNCRNLTSVAVVGKLQRLRHLDLSRVRLSSECLDGVQQCRGLTYLNLSDCELCSINALHTLLQLKELHAKSNPLTNGGITGLAHCLAMEQLYFTKCKLLTSVEELRKSLPQLDVLDVYGTAVPSRVAGMPSKTACAIM